MKFEIKPCKTRAAFNVKPLNNVNVDIKKLARKFKVKKITPIAGVFIYDGEEFIVHRYGQITFKSLKDENKIKKIAQIVYEK
ncbi:MAG: hypothetical protein QXG86_01185 [Candidatus Woesearchaeota archaeon]